MPQLPDKSESRLARLNRLEAALSAAPDSTLAWHWRVQIKVLRFIVARYGANCLFVSSLSPKALWPDFVLPERAHPPKTPRQIRRFLYRIQEINATKPVEQRRARSPSSAQKTFWLLDPEQSDFARWMLTDLGVGRANPRFPLLVRILSLLMHYGPQIVVVILSIAVILGFVFLAEFGHP